jgi:predicted permease
MLTFVATFNSILPSFILIFCGWALRYWNILSDDFLEGASRLIFYIALPAMITLKFYEVSPGHLVPWLQLGYCTLITSTVILGIWWISHRSSADRSTVGVIVQGATRSNFAVMGLYLAKALFGTAGLVNATLLMVATIPLNNVTSIVVMSRYAPASQKENRPLLRLILGNPLILSLAVVPLIWIKPPVPAPILSVAHDLASLSLPLALIAIGGSLHLATGVKYLKNGGITVLLKLIVVPIVLTGGAIAMGLRGLDLASVVLFGATPTATASYVLSKKFEADSALSGWIIAVSTVGSLVTLPIFIIGLRAARLIP